MGMLIAMLYTKKTKGNHPSSNTQLDARFAAAGDRTQTGSLAYIHSNHSTHKSFMSIREILSPCVIFIRFGNEYSTLLTNLNKKVFNCKVVNTIEIYDFGFGRFSIRYLLKNLNFKCEKFKRTMHLGNYLHMGS